MRALVRSRIGIRFSRYTAASVVAATVSYLVFLLSYGPLDSSSRVAVIAGFVAGLIPKYSLCRAWAWQSRGRSKIRREVFPYVAVSVTGVLFTVHATDFLEGYVRDVTSGTVQVLLVSVAFLVSQGVFFLLKFAAFDRLVFNDRLRRRTPRRSGGQPEPAEL